MHIITEGVRGRFRLVTEADSTAPASGPRPCLGHVFVGSGLRALEHNVITLDEPVSAHLPVVLHVRWNLPLVISR